jgi:hypothetical protein
MNQEASQLCKEEGNVKGWTEKKKEYPVLKPAGSSLSAALVYFKSAHRLHFHP